MDITCEAFIKSTFIVKGKGLVFECEVITGKIDINSFIHFEILDQKHAFEITAKEKITTISGVKKGPMVLLKTDSEEQIQNIRQNIKYPLKAIFKK